MYNTWKPGAAALRLSLSVMILFISAACAAAATPARANTPSTEVIVRAGSSASATAIPTSTPTPKLTPTPNASETVIPTPTTVPKLPSERTKEIPATVNVRADRPKSVRLGDGTDANDQATPFKDKVELKYPNLGSRLNGLVTSVEAGEVTAQEAATNTPVHSGESVAVTIYLAHSVDAVVAFLENNGGDPRNTGEDHLEAYVPVGLLGQLSEQPGILRVREIVPPEPAQHG